MKSIENLKEKIKRNERSLTEEVSKLYTLQSEAALKFINDNKTQSFEAYYYGCWCPIIYADEVSNRKTSSLVTILNNELYFPTISVQIRTNRYSKIAYPIVPIGLKYIRRISDKVGILQLI